MPKVGPPFFLNLVLSVTRYHGQLSSCTVSEKNDKPVLRKFSHRWTDGWTVRLRVIS